MPISDTRQQDLLALTPLIRRVVAARVRDPQVVDDLVQETFARLLQAGPRLDDGALAPFAVVLARNVAVSFVRGRFTEARHRHRLVELTEPDRPEERALRQEEARAVAEEHPAADGHRVPAVRRLGADRLSHRPRAAHRRRLPRHDVPVGGHSVQRHLGYVRRDQRLLGTTIDSVGARAVSRRFRLALAWIGTGTLLGALLPVLGMAVIAAFIPYHWLPIRGETAKPRRDRGGDQA